MAIFPENFSDVKEVLGFGEHSFPSTADTVLMSERRKKALEQISIVCLAVTGVLALSTGAAIVVFPTFVPILVVSSGVGICSTAGFASSCVYSVYINRRDRFAAAGVFNRCDIVDSALPSTKDEVQLSEVSAKVFKSSKESFVWKMKLIRAAEHNIVISGNYAGGVCFDQLLEAIGVQMREKKNLKATLILSSKFIDNLNYENIEKLREEFPDRISFVYSDDIYHVGPSLKKSTNHTKGMFIDYGKYFILGGDGIEDKYALRNGTGDRGNQKKAEELKEEGNDPRLTAGGWINMFLPRGFREMSWIFSANPAGDDGKSCSRGLKGYREMLKLVCRWEAINEDADPESILWSQNNGIVNSLARSLLEESFDLEKVAKNSASTRIEDFHKSHQKVDKVAMRILTTGPEHADKTFLKELISQINKADKEIVIAHLFFHPPKSLLVALANALDRGVKVKLISNGNLEKSPTGHKVFVPRSKWNVYKLRELASAEGRENFSYFEYTKPRKTTFHKKLIVIDGETVIAGSSNLGYKSLQSMSDHEMNFVAKSKQMAEKTLVVVDRDLEECERITDFALTHFDMYKSAVHRLNAWLIG